MLRITNTDKAPAAIGPYSQAVAFGNILFTSGQIPLDASTGTIIGTTIIEQATQVFKNIKAILDENGIGFENVIKTTCFVSDMKDFAEFNLTYAQYFTAKPARSCVAVKELPKCVLCEVEVIAALNA